MKTGVCQYCRMAHPSVEQPACLVLRYHASVPYYAGKALFLIIRPWLDFFVVQMLSMSTIFVTVIGSTLVFIDTVIFHVTMMHIVVLQGKRCFNQTNEQLVRQETRSAGYKLHFANFFVYLFHEPDIYCRSWWTRRLKRDSYWMMKSTSLCLSIVSEWKLVMRKDMS